MPRQRRSTKGSVIATPNRLRRSLQNKKTQGGEAGTPWQQAGAAGPSSSLSRPVTAGPRQSEEEDLQWAKTAMLSSDQLSEHLSAIAAKATSVPVAEHLSSTFYLDAIDHLHSPAKARPRPSSASAAATTGATPPLQRMARELGVELRTPRTLSA